jgi:hypothetical protein
MPEQSITANRLTDGAVVWLTPSGDWSEQVRQAAIYTNEAAAKPGLDQGVADEARQLVVAAYAVDVAVTPEGPRPLRLRERIRAEGPTVRSDLGYQAEAASS